MHVLFYCQVLVVCSLVKKYWFLLIPILQVFSCRIPLNLACLAYLDCLLFPFSAAQHDYFISDIMGYFWAGNDRSAGQKGWRLSLICNLRGLGWEGWPCMQDHSQVGS